MGSGEASAMSEYLAWIANSVGLATVGQHIRHALNIEAEIERVSVEFEILTGTKENSRKLLGIIKEKAKLLSGMSIYSLMDIFYALVYESKRRLAYGIPINDVIERNNKVETLEDLFVMRFEKMPL